MFFWVEDYETEKNVDLTKAFCFYGNSTHFTSAVLLQTASGTHRGGYKNLSFKFIKI